MNDNPRNTDTQRPLSERKAAIRSLADRLAPERDAWIAKAGAYYGDDRRYMRFLVPPGLRVLELGCGTGQLLASLEPAYGVGVDFSSRMIEVARSKHPHLQFSVGDIEDPATIAAVKGPFDVIILSDTIGSLEDCEATLAGLHPLCTPDTRVIIAYYGRVWEPFLKVFGFLRRRMPTTPQNWLSTREIASLLELADFQIVRREWRQLVPLKLLGVGGFINRYLGTLPFLRRFCLRNYIVARPSPQTMSRPPSTTVVIPCRNESGNIEAALQRMPHICDDLEIIFVEGGSQDGTWEEIQRVISAYPQFDVKAVKQDGRGKGDAVRKGFSAARGDILMILDADLTMPPEALPKFYNALASGKGEFINGSRLVYPMEKHAMQFLNFIANRSFSVIISALINQRLTDTLCGTKVLRRAHYDRISAGRSYFGDFDPFGDFDLIFGAAKLNLRIVEVPIRYAARSYGETQILRFRHGWQLLRMVVFAYRKMKAV